MFPNVKQPVKAFMRFISSSALPLGRMGKLPEITNAGCVCVIIRNLLSVSLELPSHSLLMKDTDCPTLNLLLSGVVKDLLPFS